MDQCDAKTDLVKYMWVSDQYFLILPFIIVIDFNYFYTLKNGAGHTCDLSRSGVNLPIWRLPLRPPDEAAKIPIFMNSDFSLFPKAKTCFPITADACFI